MAGHSKWANIQYRKSAQDNKRAKMFTRLIKEITISVKLLGPDPNHNAKLRNTIANAKGVNIPKEKIEKAIKKASGTDAIDYKELYFEGYGPYGIALFVECASDNLNRTTANIRAIFNKSGGSLAKSGETRFSFERKGVFVINTLDITSLEEFELNMIDYGLEEARKEGDVVILYSHFKDFGKIQEKLETYHISPISAHLERIPIELKILNPPQYQTLLDLIEKLEENEDVQEVYHNLKINEK